MGIVAICTELPHLFCFLFISTAMINYWINITIAHLLVLIPKVANIT